MSIRLAFCILVDTMSWAGEELLRVEKESAIGDAGSRGAKSATLRWGPAAQRR